MQPDALRAAREWLDQAREDLLASARLLGGAPPLLRPGAFHAQQAAEKALKAFLTAHNSAFPRTHDLGRLTGLCSTIDLTFSPYIAALGILTPYAVESRYPDGGAQPSRAEADDALRLARDIVDFVGQRLGA